MKHALRAGLLWIACTGGAHGDEGRTLYESLCQSCHGPAGRGDGAGMPAEALKPRAFQLAAHKFDTDADWEKGSDADLANVIRHGAAAYGGSPLMPPWPQLAEDDVRALVAYIRTLQQPASAAAAPGRD
jgi:mono/diheme cytochrome c family protein